MVRVTVRRHVPNANVPIRRPLDPTRAEDPVRVAVHQQRQHHPRVILRRSGAPFVHLEPLQRHPFHRLNHEVRQIVLRQPIAQVRRQQIQLRLVPLYELRHLLRPPQLDKPYYKTRASKSDRLLAPIHATTPPHGAVAAAIATVRTSQALVTTKDAFELLDRIVARIEGLVRDEILARGIRFPTGGIEHGLLDFSTTFDGRVVYLCWKRGESQVSHWHEINGGFAGRQPLTTEHAVRMGVNQW